MSTDTVLQIGIRVRDEGAAAAFASVNAELAQTDRQLATVNARVRETSAQFDSLDARAVASADAQRVMQQSFTETGAAVQSTAATLRGEYSSALAAGADEQLRLGSITEETAGKIALAKRALDEYTAAMRVASGEADVLAAREEAAYMRMEAAGVKAYEREQIAADRAAEREIADSERKAKAAEAATARQAKAAETALARSRASSDAQVAKLAKTGTVIGAVGLAFEAFGIKSSVSLDTAEHHVQAFTNAIGNGKTQITLQKLRFEIQSLADDTGISAAKLTEGFYNIASSGLSAQKSMAILKESTKFAAASQTDAAVAMKLLTSVTNAYGLSLPQIKQAQDDITQATKQGTMEAADYAPALAQIIPVAAHLGVGLKDLGSWFTVLTNNGISAAESGVYLGNMLNHLLAPTDQQIKTVKLLGGTYDDLVVHQGHVGDTLKRLNDLIEKHVPVLKELENGQGKVSDRAERFAEALDHADGRVRKLFGGNMDAARAFFSLMANGQANLHAATLGMANDAGSTEAAYKTAMTSMANDFHRAFQEADHLARELSGPLLTGLDAIAKAGGPAAGSVAKLAHEHQTMTGILDGGLVGLLATSLAIRGVRYVAEPLIGVVRGLGGAFAADGAGAGALALALNPITLVLAAVTGGIVGTAIEAHKLNDQIDAGHKAAIDYVAAYASGRITMQQFLQDTHGVGGAVAELARKQYDQAKATREGRDALLQQTAALKQLGLAADAFNGKDFLGLKLNYSGGKADPKNGGSGNTSSHTAAPFDIQKAITHASAMIDNWAEKVAADGRAFGPHSAQVEWDRKELGKWTDTSVALKKEWDGLTTTTKQLKTAGLDPFQAGFQKARDALASATDAIAEDKRKGIPVSAAQRRAFDDATAAVKRYQRAQDDADGTSAKREAEKARREHDAWVQWKKRQDQLADAAEKAAKALLKTAAAALAKPGAEGAESATRAGQFAQIGKPSGSGGTDPISLLEQRINNLDPRNFASEGAFETALQGLYTKLDAAIKSYGKKLQSQWDAGEKKINNDPNIPGSDAWVKAWIALWNKTVKSPEVVAGIANISREAGFAQRGSFGGTAAANRTAATDLQDQVNLGILAKANADRQNTINLKVAESTGDVAAQFQILSQEMEGPYNQAFAQVQKDYLTHSGNVQADSDALRASTKVKYDEAVGQREATRITTEGLRDAALAATDFAEYWKNATGLNNQALSDSQDRISGAYRSGGAPTQADIEAYQRNKAAVDQDTQSVLMMDHATGQYAAELQGRMAQATQRSSDAEALLTEKIHDRIPVSVEEVQAARDAVQADKDWTEAQRQATEMVGTIPEKWDAMLQDMSTGLDNAVKTLASDLLGGMTDSNFGAQLRADAEAGAAFQQQTMAMSEAESEAKIRILEAAGAFGDAHSQELEAAKAKADADYANASAAGASADQLQSLYQAASDASYALTAWQNTLSSPDQQGSQDANQQSFDNNGFETSYGYQQDQQAAADYQSQLDSQLQAEMQAQQQAVTQGIADGFATTQAQQDRKKLDLEHEKAMIQLNTSLDPTTKAYQIQSIQLQEDDLAIQTDTLKYQQLAASGGTVAELMQAQNQILADTYKKQEDIAAGIQQIATNTGNDSAALASQVKTLQELLQQRNSPAGSTGGYLRNPGSNVTLSQLMGPQASDFQANVTP